MTDKQLAQFVRWARTNPNINDPRIIRFMHDAHGLTEQPPLPLEADSYPSVTDKP